MHLHRVRGHGMPNPICRSFIASALLALGSAHSAFADHEHMSNEFEVFVAGEAYQGSGQAHAGDDDTWFDADVVFGLTEHKFRVFGEYYITPEERDLERLQFGYEFVPETVLWLGRFHQPGSAWNTEHHHGRYLQTSVTRPSVELWEDELGIIPQHITGLMVDSRRQAGDYGGLQLAAGAGFGTTITDQGLDPVDLLDPHFAGRRLALSGRIAYLPDFVGTSAFGLLVSHCDMPVLTKSTAAMLHADRVDQTVYGGFANWNGDLWRLTSAVYAGEMNLTGMVGSRRDNFVPGFAPLKKQL